MERLIEVTPDILTVYSATGIVRAGGTRKNAIRIGRDIVHMTGKPAEIRNGRGTVLWTIVWGIGNRTRTVKGSLNHG